MRLNTGDARERTSLWTRKSRLEGPFVRRIRSASGASNLSSLVIVVVLARTVGRVAW